MIAVLCSFENNEKCKFQTDITGTNFVSAVVISWRYLRFRARFDHHNILYGLIKNEIPKITFFIYTYIWYF